MNAFQLERLENLIQIFGQTPIAIADMDRPTGRILDVSNDFHNNMFPFMK